MARSRSLRALAAAAAGAAVVAATAAPASASTLPVRPDHGCYLYANAPYYSNTRMYAAAGFQCSDYHFNFGGTVKLEDFQDGGWATSYSVPVGFTHTYSNQTHTGSGPHGATAIADQVCPAHVFGTPSLWRTELDAHDGQGNHWTLISETFSCK